MATNIPGRRVSNGETFYTDWSSRGGDCALLRAQALIKESASGEIHISMETRSEEDTATTTMDTVFPSSTPRLLKLTAVGVKTAIYTATTGSNSPARGFKEQWRMKITTSGMASGDYFVVRIFPPTFFDNSITGS